MDIYIEFRYEVKAYRRDCPGKENEHDAGEDGAPRHPVRVQRYPDLRKKRRTNIAEQLKAYLKRK